MIKEDLYLSFFASVV